MSEATLLLLTGLPGTGKSTLAEQGARRLDACVLAHDWAMAGLRPYRGIEAALEEMDIPTRRSVGWSLLWSLARAQLNAARSVVLDGVARADEVAGTRALAAEVGARCLVVRSECPDEELHRSRIVGRIRAIPGWYELSWQEVAWARARWTADAPADVDLVLDTTASKEAACAHLDALLGEPSRPAGTTEREGSRSDGTNDVKGCLACDLTSGRHPLPGGRIHETRHLVVEHCVGPLGLGTLIVKPKRHVTALDALTGDEALELGPLLRDAAAVAGELVDADQVYACLWSHAGRAPGHLHFVVQPVGRAEMTRLDAVGPRLQTQLFDENVMPEPDEIEEVAERARRWFRAAKPPRR